MQPKNTDFSQTSEVPDYPENNQLNENNQLPDDLPDNSPILVRQDACVKN